MAKKQKPIVIEWKRLSIAYGYAYPDERRIELDPRMKPERLLEIAAHEVIHVELPDLDETAVLRVGKNIADVLLRLGFWQKPKGDE